MGFGAAPFILIALLWVIGVPVLAIVAYVRVGAVKSAAQAEAAQLIRRIYALEQRLAQIEEGVSALKAAAVAHPPVPATPPVSMPLPTQPARPSVVSAPLSPTHTPAPVRAHVPALSQQPMSRGRMTSDAASGNFEEVVAGRWLNYVGILALLFAVTFFLKYAFDNNWVGPRGRVGIGLLAGSILYPWSHHLLARGYKYFSEGIAGLGAAVLYLSLWAGWHYYHIFSQDVAFMAMIAVTAVTLA